MARTFTPIDGLLPSSTLLPSSSTLPLGPRSPLPSSVEVPHFAYPFVLDVKTRHVAVVEQDAPEHVMACENVIVRCPVGFRVENPEFGIPWPEYNQIVDPHGIEVAMRRLEPRSSLTATELRSLTDPSESTVTIEVES